MRAGDANNEKIWVSGTYWMQQRRRVILIITHIQWLSQAQVGSQFWKNHRADSLRLPILTTWYSQKRQLHTVNGKLFLQWRFE